MSEAVIDLVRRRGDTYPIRLYVVDTEAAPVDITACTFKLTVDPSEAPADAAGNIFQLTGTIVSAVDGEAIFEPSAANMDHVGDYFYDVEMTDADGVITTLVTGKLTFKQDITKPV